MDWHFLLLEAERQGGESQSRRVRGNLCTRESILHQTVSMLPFAYQVFQGSWTVDIHEGQSEISFPEETRAVHPGNLGAGIGEVIRHTTHLGECACQAPSCLSCSDLGRAQNRDQTESVPLWSTRDSEPEWLRPGKCTKPRAYFRQFPCRAAWSLTSVEWESTHA